MQLPNISPSSLTNDNQFKRPTKFPIGPFVKYCDNPILVPDPDIDFECGHLYNATAIVVDNKVFMLYRAQDKQLVSSIGIAWSHDGFRFIKYIKPVISPTTSQEQGGGCEDPRIVRNPENGMFVVTYTAYDKRVARLCIATSYDLFHWEKVASFLPESWYDIQINDDGSRQRRYGWLKSGSIFTERGKDGLFWMVFGDSLMYLASSPDMVEWTLRNSNCEGITFAEPKYLFELKLIECGPAPIKLKGHKNQWILFYNSCTLGNEDFCRGTYSISQMLIDYDELDDGPISRLKHPILWPQHPEERSGLVNNVVFCEGIVQFNGQWLLYYGEADSKLGVAVAPVE